MRPRAKSDNFFIRGLFSKFSKNSQNFTNGLCPGTILFVCHICIFAPKFEYDRHMGRNKDIIVIGGGIIGLSTAYYLQKEGHRVTVLDKSNIDSGASFVNAGYMTPSHIIPLAAPGKINQGLKFMFNPSS